MMSTLTGFNGFVRSIGGGLGDVVGDSFCARLGVGVHVCSFIQYSSNGLMLTLYCLHVSEILRARKVL
jgi:hypothetical protein